MKKPAPLELLETCVKPLRFHIVVAILNIKIICNFISNPVLRIEIKNPLLYIRVYVVTAYFIKLNESLQIIRGNSNQLIINLCNKTYFKNLRSIRCNTHTKSYVYIIDKRKLK